MGQISVEERRAAATHAREKQLLWRELYAGHCALQRSLHADPDRITLFGRRVIADPRAQSAPPVSLEPESPNQSQDWGGRVRDGAESETTCVTFCCQ